MTQEVEISALIRLLAPSVGQKKAEALIAEAAHALGLRTDAVSREDALRILDKIKERMGLR
jgi:hypothetical protein